MCRKKRREIVGGDKKFQFLLILWFIFNAASNSSFCVAMFYSFCAEIWFPNWRFIISRAQKISPAAKPKFYAPIPLRFFLSELKSVWRFHGTLSANLLYLKRFFRNSIRRKTFSTKLKKSSFKSQTQTRLKIMKFYVKSWKCERWRSCGEKTFETLNFFCEIRRVWSIMCYNECLTL